MWVVSICSLSRGHVRGQAFSLVWRAYDLEADPWEMRHPLFFEAS